MDKRKALSKIQQKGALLVFPVQNQKQPPSLWREFYPRSNMRWEWDESGDDRVARLWRLREALSRSGKVAYLKWYRNRATLLSLEVFEALLTVLRTHARKPLLGQAARQILERLEENTPQSTKSLKKELGLSNTEYDKAMKELWEGAHTVGFGEVDDGAFPSLAVGASALVFDSIYQKARAADPLEAERFLGEKLGSDSLFLKYLARLKKRLPEVAPLEVRHSELRHPEPALAPHSKDGVVYFKDLQPEP